MSSSAVSLVDAWRVPEARVFFRNVWPLYLHELSGFDTDFYFLDDTGRFNPDIVEDWISATTPPSNLRAAHGDQDSAQPFQRTYVVASDARPVGFVCVGLQPFKYMPEDVEASLAEFFLVHRARGTGTALRALELLLERHRGRWHLQAIHDNARAIRFWRTALPALRVRDLEERRVGGDLEFRFVVG